MPQESSPSADFGNPAESVPNDTDCGFDGTTHVLSGPLLEDKINKGPDQEGTHSR